MILAKTQYKTHDGKLLTIVQAFKTQKHYLKGYKYNVLIVTNHNKFQRFIYIKNLNSRQVQYAEKLSKYYFQIDYQQKKANKAANVLSQYAHWSTEEEETFQAENTNTLH